MLTVKNVSHVNPLFNKIARLFKDDASIHLLSIV
jgi:hypothetical protein